MKSVKVRNALMVYTVEREDGRVLTEMAFRGVVVELDDAQAAAKIEGGEAVPVDEELPRPGDLPKLNNEASAEEALNWALAATKSEIQEALESNPSHRPVLEAALSLAQERQLDAAAHLNSALGSPSAPVQEAEEVAPQNASEPEAAETPESIVKKNVDQVSAFLSHNPHLASEVLDAENALAADLGRNPRSGVVQAVEAAVQHMG